MPHRNNALQLRVKLHFVFLLQCNARGKHAIAAEVQHKHEKQNNHAAKRGGDDDIEHVWGALQPAGVVEVHSEDPAHVGAEAEAAGQDRQHRVRDQQLVAGRVQPEGQLHNVWIGQRNQLHTSEK